MAYVDGFIIPLPTKNLKVYRRIAQKFGKVWRDHGALAFRECVADDVKVGKWTSFPRSVKLKRGETVVWSYIVYKSRGASRPRQRQGHEGPADDEHNESEGLAVRRQTDDLRRVQGVGRGVTRSASLIGAASMLTGHWRSRGYRPRSRRAARCRARLSMAASGSCRS